MEEFESLGVWWIPSNPDQQVTGTIKFSHEVGILLEIIGSFNDQGIYSFHDKNSTQEIIIGIIHRKLVTLINCHRKGGNISFPGIQTQIYTVRVVLLNHHFLELESIKFNKFKVDFNYLKYLSHFQYNLNFSNQDLQNANLKETSLSFYTFNNLRANVIQCEIFIKEFIATHGNAQEMSVNKSSFIEVFLKNKESLETIFKNVINPLSSFFTLASSQPNHITSLFLYLEFDEDIKEIEVIFKQSIFRTTEDVMKTKNHNFLFTLDEIKQDFSLIMQRWFNLFDKAKDIMNVYFSTVYNSKLYAENTFLSRVQALESYHRRMIDKNNSYTEEHQIRLEHILEKTPTEYKSWLKEKLLFSHEPSLEQRLQELCKLTHKTISPLVNNSDGFIKKVKNIRNYLTHYSNPSDSKLIESTNLFRINQILGFMMQSCLLQELGCSDARCEELIGRSQEYQYLKTLDIKF